MRIKVTLDQYIILHLVDKKKLVSFDEIVMYLNIYRDEAVNSIDELIHLRLLEVYDPNAFIKVKSENGVIPFNRAIQEIEYKGVKQVFDDYNYPLICKYENVCFVADNTGNKLSLNWVKPPFLWRTRKTITTVYRKTQRILSTRKELAEMAAKKRKAIEEAGKTAEIKLQRKWAKKILKSKCKTYIIKKIEKAGYAEDPKERVNNVLLLKLLEESIGYVAEYKGWGIETNSGLPELEPYECLTLYLPDETAYYFYK